MKIKTGNMSKTIYFLHKKVFEISVFEISIEDCIPPLKQVKASSLLTSNFFLIVPKSIGRLTIV